jgi:hypothetical protein
LYSWSKRDQCQSINQFDFFVSPHCSYRAESGSKFLPFLLQNRHQSAVSAHPTSEGGRSMVDKLLASLGSDISHQPHPQSQSHHPQPGSVQDKMFSLHQNVSQQNQSHSNQNSQFRGAAQNHAQNEVKTPARTILKKLNLKSFRVY